jgi:hypothetical protein
MISGIISGRSTASPSPPRRPSSPLLRPPPPMWFRCRHLLFLYNLGSGSVSGDVQLADCRVEGTVVLCSAVQRSGLLPTEIEVIDAYQEAWVFCTRRWRLNMVPPMYQRWFCFQNCLSVFGDVQLELVTFRFLQRFSLHPLEAVSVLAATV